MPNTATVSSLTPDPVEANEASTVTFSTGAPPADIQVGEVGPADHRGRCSAAAYTISVANHGPSEAASAADRSSHLPTGASVVGRRPRPRGTCVAPATCGLGPLPVGRTASITIDVMFDSDAAVGPRRTRDGVARRCGHDPNTGNDTGTSTANVTGNADLSMVKTADPGTAVPGDPIEVPLRARNAGPSTGPRRHAPDALPADFTFVSAVADPGILRRRRPTASVACAVGDIPSRGRGHRGRRDGRPPPASPVPTSSTTAAVSSPSTAGPGYRRQLGSFTVTSSPSRRHLGHEARRARPGGRRSAVTWTSTVSQRRPVVRRRCGFSDPLRPVSTPRPRRHPRRGTCTVRRRCRTCPLGTLAAGTQR